MKKLIIETIKHLMVAVLLSVGATICIGIALLVPLSILSFVISLETSLIIYGIVSLIVTGIIIYYCFEDLNNTPFQ